MKKALLIFFIFFAARAYSQTISYGISAGLNYTNLPGTGTLNLGTSADYIAGYRVGVLMDIGFKAFSIQPGIFFTTTGGHGRVNFINGTNIDYVNNQIVLDYVKIPVNFLFKIKTGSGSLFIGGGPYAAIGVSGKISYATNKSYGTTDNVTFGSNSWNIKSSEFGMQVLEGYKLNSGVAISAGYCFALTNTYNTSANNRNRGFNVSVDYFF